MGAGSHERRFARTVKVKASPERIWETLTDPFALSWMAAGCLYTAPVPPTSETSSDLRCYWRRASNSMLVGGVVEVEVREDGRRLQYLDLSASRPLRFEFTLVPKGSGCRVEVAGIWNQARYLPRSVGTPKHQVWRTAELLRGAVSWGPESEPEFSFYALDGSGARPQELVRRVDISAPLDVIWAVADDPDGSLVNSPTVVRQWRLQASDAELFFAVNRNDAGEVGCNVSQVLRHAEHHVTTRSSMEEVEYRLLPRGDGGELTIIHRWDERVRLIPEAAGENHDAWLLRVKAAAETLARQG